MQPESDLVRGKYLRRIRSEASSFCTVSDYGVALKPKRFLQIEHLDCSHSEYLVSGHHSPHSNARNCATTLCDLSLESAEACGQLKSNVVCVNNSEVCDSEDCMIQRTCATSHQELPAADDLSVFSGLTVRLFIYSNSETAKQ